MSTRSAPHQLSKVVHALSQEAGQPQSEGSLLLLRFCGIKQSFSRPCAAENSAGAPPLTWEVFHVHAAQVTQSVFVVGGVVPDDAVIFAGQVVEAAVHRRHAGQVVQNLLHLLDDFLWKTQETVTVSPRSANKPTV